ncbi:hypothetical protein [Bremerella volcania]|uniref:hypothetical protein n=1 Tax=Bremerella volcania TaxID=2527984 RepID=UPI001F4F75B4|nr:hypothetical protein [Bremerella volcania]
MSITISGMAPENAHRVFVADDVVELAVDWMFDDPKVEEKILAPLPDAPSQNKVRPPSGSSIVGVCGYLVRSAAAVA